MNRENTKLNELARLFQPYADLYAVGGYVRDGILNYQCGDLDICSKLAVDDVKKALLNTDFVVLDKNLRVGTVMIKAKDFSCEYTTFRCDSYRNMGGAHTPCDVEFTSDMRTDALRRDFKMNAVYLNPLSGEYVDLLGGTDDIKNKIISTTDNAEKVFSEDGLRLLRLVRFAAELNFDIEKATFEAARANSFRICDIAPERIADELNKIFVADTAHISPICEDNLGCENMRAGNKSGENAPCKNTESGLHIMNPIYIPTTDGAEQRKNYIANTNTNTNTNNTQGHFRGITLLDELGLLDILLPELAALKGLEQTKKYHLYDAYHHSLEAFRVAPCKIRWAALLHDVGKKIAVCDHGNMHGHEICGAEAVRVRLNALRFPKAEITRICKLVENHMADINGNMSEDKLRWFIAERAEIMDDLCDLKDADCLASRGEKGVNRLRETYNAMKAEGAPLSIKQLKVDGRDLLHLGVPEKDRSAVLTSLWRETVMNGNLNNRENALRYLEKAVGKEWI